MNRSSSQTMVPPAMTRAVSSVVAKNVAKLIVAFSSGAQLRWPARASRSAPRRGTPTTSAISTLVLLELFHMPDVEAVEALADMEEKYSEYEGVDQATMAVEVASAAPCQARSLMSVSTRRCDSIANAISRRKAASTFTSWARSGIAKSAFHQEVRQHAEHGEQERGGQELRREKQ